MTERFKKVFKTEKPIIGMLHLLGDSPQGIIDNAIEEMKMMTKHGVDAVLVENYFGSTQDVENVLDVLNWAYPDVVYGVNVLGDIETAYKFARWYDAKFIQVDSICGHHVPARERSYFEKIDALREDCDALLLGGVRFKYQPVCSGRSVEEDLEIGRQHCDAIVVTGSGTGIATGLEKIKMFRSALGEFPLVVGAGMTADTVAEQLAYADGGIVGSYFKYNGDAYGYMDEERVARFMERVANCRDRVDRSAVEKVGIQTDEILALPEKRMREYFEGRISLLDPLVQSSLCYYLEPYYIDDTMLKISRIDAREVMSYLRVLSISRDSETKRRIYSSPEYFFNKLTERQQEIARDHEQFADDVISQINAEKTAIEAYKKETADIRKKLVKANDEFISACSPETQAVIRYEECRKDPGRGTSGFHGFGGSADYPFSVCGWATFDGEWGGVAFRINKDCFDGRDAVLYYKDDDFFGNLPHYNVEWLQKIRNGIEQYSSGLTDIQICEQVEQNNFMFRGHLHSPARVTTIRFRLDSSKIKDTVEISTKPVPTSEIGEYIFVLPKEGEFYIELGEILDGKRVPLHYDDFCMK